MCLYFCSVVLEVNILEKQMIINPTNPINFTCSSIKLFLINSAVKWAGFFISSPNDDWPQLAANHRISNEHNVHLKLDHISASGNHSELL